MPADACGSRDSGGVSALCAGGPASGATAGGIIPLPLSHGGASSAPRARASGVVYELGVPEAGRLWTQLEAGRAELLARLRLRAYKEMPRAEAEALRLARCHLDSRFILRDALGRGIVEAVDTAAGPSVRLPR